MNTHDHERSVPGMNCQGCVLLELGAHRPARRILFTTASGTASGLKFLTVRRVLMHS